MKCITIKLETFTATNEKNVVTNLDELKSAFQAALDTNERRLLLHPHFDFEAVAEFLKEIYGNLITTRQGVMHGCYGSSTGQQSKGVTVYCDHTLFPDRLVETDTYGDETETYETVNIGILLDEYAVETEIDPDSLRETCEILGHEIKGDNTYNYLGQSSEDPNTLFDVNFESVQTEDCEYGAKLVIVKFHCGGDPRGNYTSEVVYKFNDSENFYTVFNPSCELLDTEGE